MERFLSKFSPPFSPSPKNNRSLLSLSHATDRSFSSLFSFFFRHSSPCIRRDIFHQQSLCHALFCAISVSSFSAGAQVLLQASSLTNSQAATMFLESYQKLSCQLSGCRYAREKS